MTQSGLKKYQLAKIEADIRPEDFREDSIWREVVALFGPGPIVFLSKLMPGDRVYIPDYDTVTKGARKRGYTATQSIRKFKDSNL